MKKVTESHGIYFKCPKEYKRCEMMSVYRITPDSISSPTSKLPLLHVGHTLVRVLTRLVTNCSYLVK